jgi:hypothetical protein
MAREIARCHSQYGASSKRIKRIEPRAIAAVLQPPQIHLIERHFCPRIASSDDPTDNNGEKDSSLCDIERVAKGLSENSSVVLDDTI